MRLSKELQERDLIVGMERRAVISSKEKRRSSRSDSANAESESVRRPSFAESSPQRRQSFTQEASPPRRSSRTSSRSSMQSSLFTPDASEDEIKFDPRVVYSTSTSGDEF
ncbi:hypothetical protein Poli38472_003701 [Pythium oligandrum]|uniref:Uncharacterized protein n=1 Tax=Pythium oligandrum TaxID=41045 RepID=A0A8K1CNM7_PYTOL|nr:hypothetical protein Poli38472_003701 [Pythium oligandrum]|eukprot:TMW65936.1 hypothetical protein Poli38472_003701 [Pythium oligandrum]